MKSRYDSGDQRGEREVLRVFDYSEREITPSLKFISTSPFMAESSIATPL
jgi:hypothetical protein